MSSAVLDLVILIGEALVGGAILHSTQRA